VDPRTTPQPPPYVYEAKVTGTDNLLGRAAYVVELTIVPGGSIQSSDSQVPDHVKIWVDQQLYVVLRSESWSADGRLLQSSGYQAFQLNGPIDPAAFNFTPPQDADVVDMRTVDSVELGEVWSQVVQQSHISLYSIVDPRLGLAPSRPTVNSARGTVSQAYWGKVRVEAHPQWGVAGGDSASSGSGTALSTVPQLVLTQGPPSAINTANMGTGRPVQISGQGSDSADGTITGYIYRPNGIPALVFDRGATRIKLMGFVYPSGGASKEASLQAIEGLLVRGAEALKPVEQK
jgi:hypothetical protein